MDPDQMVYPFLQEKTRYLKQDTKGVTHMCKIMEEIKAEGYAEGLEDVQMTGSGSAVFGWRKE